MQSVSLNKHSTKAAVVEIEMRLHKADLHDFTSRGYVMVAGSGRTLCPALCVFRANPQDLPNFNEVKITDLTLSTHALDTNLTIDGASHWS